MVEYPSGSRNTVRGNQTIQRNDDGATAGPYLIVLRESASPANSDALGAIIFQGRDSGAGLQTYAQIRTIITDMTAGSEDATLSFQTPVAGVEADRLIIGAGLYSTNATGGDKGIETINFKAVYDDNVLLTDYVFDRFLGDKSFTYSARVQERADALDAAMFDPSAYAAYWRDHRRLYGMPDLNDCIEGVVKEHSLGALVQMLMLTVELQAIHTDKLNRRLQALEAKA